MLIQTASSLVIIEEFSVTAARLVDGPFGRCAEATILSSKNRLKSDTLKDWDSDLLAESFGCIAKRFPSGLFSPLGSYRPTYLRRRPVSLLRPMNSAVLLLKNPNTGSG